MPRQLGKLLFLAHMDGVGGQGVEPPVGVLGILALDIGGIYVRLG